MKRRLLVIFCVLLLTLVLVVAAGCTSGEEEQTGTEQEQTGTEEQEPAAPSYEMSYLGGSFGENLAFALAGSEILTRYDEGLNVGIVKSAGSEMNTLMAATMPSNGVIYHTTSMDFIASYFGIAPWEEAYPDQRLITSYNPGCMAFVTQKPDLSITDMEGMTLSVLPLPSLQMAFLENCMELTGMTGKINIVQLDFGANEDAMRDGTTDGLFASFYNPAGHEDFSPAMHEVLYALNNDMYFVDIPKDVVAEAAASLKAGFGVREVQPNSEILPNETRSVWAETCVFSAAAVKADMDEDLAYRITKTILEHTDEFVNYDSGGQFVNPESVVQAMSYAEEDMIHPGAIKYYKEAGLWDTYLAARAEFVENVGDYSGY